MATNTGLPHYVNSRVGKNLDEPLYLNQFRVTIIPPASISADRLVLSQELLKINGLDVEQLPSNITVQNFWSTTRPFAGAKAEKTHLEMKLDFNVNLNQANSAYTYKVLRKWCDIVRDPLTGAMGLKRDYTDNGNTKVIINIHNKRGDIYRVITGYDVFPGGGPLSSMELDYASEDIFTISGFGLVASYFDDISL